MHTRRQHKPTGRNTLHKRESAGEARQALSGFTLIELLVTVAVAAILVGIAAPDFRSMVQLSKPDSRVLVAQVFHLQRPYCSPRLVQRL